MTLTPSDQDRLLANLQGLTLAEAEKLLTRLIVEDGRLDADDIRRAVEAKRALGCERDGLLEYQPSAQSLEGIADLTRLKEWLGKRRRFMEDPQRAAEFGLEFPRGVLLVGVPGCGKSLCAKAVAAAWSLPLVKLDPGALYDKYIGETEQNFRKAMGSAERLAPLVLWIDEIEKAFAAGGGDEDGGVSQRVLGSFLSWLQERRGDVFVVATANDVQRLPAELLRKGRFDETFFVDLPDEAARGAILAIHLRRRKQAPEGFDLPRLARDSQGYSGAELEQVVVSALYTAFSAGGPLTGELLFAELRQMPPIASTAREKVAFLREWAAGRTVPANWTGRGPRRPEAVPRPGAVGQPAGITASSRSARPSGSGATSCVARSSRALWRAFSVASVAPVSASGRSSRGSGSCRATGSAQVPPRVPLAEVVTAGADGLEHVDGQRLVADLDLLEQLPVPQMKSATSTTSAREPERPKSM